MSMAQALIAGYKAVSGSVLGWDGTTGSPVISNGGLTATNAASGGLFATLGKSSGKWLVEFTSTITNGNIGLADKTNGNAVLSNFIGAAVIESAGYRNSGQELAFLSTGTVNSGGHPTFTSASTVGVAIDFTTSPPTMNVYINGTLVWALATLPTGKTWFPCYFISGSAQSITLNTSASFPVSGFTYWS